MRPFWYRTLMRSRAAGRIPRRVPVEHTSTDVEMMLRALALAEGAAAVGEVPVGAVVYHTGTGRILGEGANRRESHHDPLGHAEMLAIRAASERLGDWRLSECTLVVTLEPCPMCAGACVNARVGRVVYGARDPKAGAVHSLFGILTDRRLNHRCQIVAGVCEHESSELLKRFFRELRIRDREH